jgi:hypothetical protein
MKIYSNITLLREFTLSVRFNADRLCAKFMLQVAGWALYLAIEREHRPCSTPRRSSRLPILDSVITGLGGIRRVLRDTHQLRPVFGAGSGGKALHGGVPVQARRGNGWIHFARLKVEAGYSRLQRKPAHITVMGIALGALLQIAPDILPHDIEGQLCARNLPVQLDDMDAEFRLDWFSGHRTLVQPAECRFEFWNSLSPTPWRTGRPSIALPRPQRSHGLLAVWR